MIRDFPLFSPLVRFVEYRRKQSLGKYGLRVDDIAIEYPPVKVALSRISDEEKIARWVVEIDVVGWFMLI
jgi:hypothetical protein